MVRSRLHRHCVFPIAAIIGLVIHLFSPAPCLGIVFLEPEVNPSQIQFAELMATAKRLRTQGDFKNALDLSIRACSIANSRGLKVGVLDSLSLQGVLFWNLGQMQASNEAFSRALEVAKVLNLPDRERIFSTAIQIFDLYVKAKGQRDALDYAASAKSFRKAIDLARSIQSKEHELKCLRQFSINYWEQKDYQEFFSLNQRALTIARDINHKKEEGRCLNNIGLFYYHIDNYSEALSHYEKALEIARLLNDMGEENLILTNSALYHNLPNPYI